MARATVSASPGLEMDAWEPPLNAKKPKNKMNPPRAAFYKAKRKTFAFIHICLNVEWFPIHVFSH